MVALLDVQYARTSYSENLAVNVRFSWLVIYLPGAITKIDSARQAG
jgi:hypothetical protein